MFRSQNRHGNERQRDGLPLKCAARSISIWQVGAAGVFEWRKVTPHKPYARLRITADHKPRTISISVTAQSIRYRTLTPQVAGSAYKCKAKNWMLLMYVRFSEFVTLLPNMAISHAPSAVCVAARMLSAP